MEKITRTISGTVIKAAEIVVVDNVLTQKEIPEFIVSGNVDEAGAIKLLRKSYGRYKNFAVIALIRQEKKYEMPLNVFIENATEVKE